MLHEGAKTRFILNNLTQAIEVSFSFRLGDPLAILLFINYIEPLLLYLERNLAGINVAGISQSLEAYCEDVNIFTTSLDDLVKSDAIVQEFEAVHGAIFSRNLKCKILSLGGWKQKTIC